MDLRSGSESKRTSKRVDYNWHCICQAICSGGSQQAQSDGIVKENVDGTFLWDDCGDTNLEAPEQRGLLMVGGWVMLELDCC